MIETPVLVSIDDDAEFASDDVVARTVSELDLDAPGSVPHWPEERRETTLGVLLVRVVVETAQHAGHADIVREMVDGATAFPLMAAVEGWPATEWMQPWQPAS